MRARAKTLTAVLGICASVLIFSTTVVLAPSAWAQGTILQGSPTENAVTVIPSTSAAFTDTLQAASGNTGPVTFVATPATSTPPGLLVQGTDQIVTTGAPLPVNLYVISGTDSDTDGDSGSWTYTLNVTAGTITQDAPTSDTVDVATSGDFNAAVSTNGSSVDTVTFTPTSLTPAGPTGLSVAGDGAITTTGMLPAGQYQVSGTDSDTYGDSGAWSYTLQVTPDPITQTSSTSASTTTDGSASFSPATITTSGNQGAVTFATSSSSAGLSVSSSGVVTTTGPLIAGSYTVSGTDNDAFNDTGTWTFTLDVSQSPSGGGSLPPTTASSLTQTSPTSGSTTPSNSSSFTSALEVSGGSGTVTYEATTTAPGLKLTGNTIATTASLSVGEYTISGTDHDTTGLTGRWTFTLTVSRRDLVQTSPTSASTTTRASKTFSAGRITVGNAAGAVTFVTTTSSIALKVSASGAITTTRALSPGTYHVAGTDRDASNNTGKWSYTLKVTGAAKHVTFRANRGKGTMRVETSSAPKALSLSHFTRAGYSFVSWNTRANGRGRSYANAATYSFSSSVTLYAQWKAGRAPPRTVTFDANGGLGAMASEVSNVPRAISLDAFTRPGYKFARWSTSANGAAASYANGATYAFASSVTLYAQWTVRKVVSHVVIFSPDGGHGTMASEKGTGPKTLSHNQFTRSGYTFAEWSTSPGGKGAIYTNGADFPFTTSITLYAQWKKIYVPPAVHATVTIATFAAKSSTLTSTLEGEISALANTAKVDHDTTISLTGYGDRLSKSDELNETLWTANYTLSQRRASAVEFYLRGRLTALKVPGVTITGTGSGSAIPTSSTPASTKFALVVASLT